MPRPPVDVEMVGYLEASAVASEAAHQFEHPIRFEGLGQAGVQAEGHGTLSGEGAETLALLRPTPGAPFRALLLGSNATLDAAEAALERAGALRGGVAEQEAARVLAGWPLLGAEIQDKTLPQEVRYDEIGGVSYTKGCYTGQETVARLHFRGHANRELRGLVWDGTPLLEDALVRGVDGKEVGQVSSVLDLDAMSLGLAVIFGLTGAFLRLNGVSQSQYS